MRAEHAVGQELAQLGVRPPLHDELRHEMEVCARIDVVRDASRDDAEDRSCPLASVIEPSEEPVLPSEDRARDGYS